MQKSTIQKVIFDVNYPDQNSAHAFQNKIIAEFNVNIQKDIDNIVTEYTKNYLVTAECIELDLGTLSKEDCETSLSELIKEKLRNYFAELRQKLEMEEIPEGMEVVHLAENIYDYLYNYLKYGMIPWNLEYFSYENKLDYWLKYLVKEDIQLFYKILLLLQEEAPRKRFLSVVPIHENYSLIQEVFSPKLGNILLESKNILQDLISKSKQSVESAAIGNFLLFLSSELVISGNIISDATFFSEVFFKLDVLLNNQYFTEILPGIIQLKKEILPEEQRIFLRKLAENYLAETYLEEIVVTNELNIEFPQQRGEVFRSWESYKKLIESKLPSWSRDILATTRKLSPQISSYFEPEDARKIEGLIREIFFDTLQIADFPEDIDLWYTLITEKLLKVFGKEIIPKAEVVIEEFITKQKKVEKPIKQIRTTLEKFIVNDGGKQIKFDLESSLQYLKIFAQVGINTLKMIYSDPVNVLSQILIALSDKYPRYYQVEIRKIAEAISPLEFVTLIKSEIIKTEIPEKIREDLIVASSIESLEEQLKTSPKDIGGYFLLEILYGRFLPTYIVQEKGIGYISKAIQNYINRKADDFEKVVVKLNLQPQRADFEYLKALIDAKSFNKILSIFSIKKYPELIGDKDKAKASVIRFQLGVSLFLSGEMTEKQVVDFIQIIQGLIDSKHSEFAKYILSLPEGQIKQFKAILPKLYQDKIDRLVISFQKRLNIKPDVKEEEAGRKLEEGEVIYIRNSGLIILNPYFNTLFSRLGLVENKKFISDDSRFRAIQIMHYLVTKSTEWEEPDIILNKILVGMAPSEPIGEIRNITSDEIDMCESLLEAVVKNWGVLKSTSTDSLRGSFLIRNGRISREPSNWKLIVERKSYDVLLDKLPWSFSAIKLPWMEFPLITEW